MMLVPADSFNVVPGRCLVAFVALIDLGMRFACNCGRDHLEVHHVMTRRSLVTLATIVRLGGGMLIFGNRPAIAGVAGGTIRAE